MLDVMNLNLTSSSETCSANDDDGTKNFHIFTTGINILMNNPSSVKNAVSLNIMHPLMNLDTDLQEALMNDINYNGQVNHVPYQTLSLKAIFCQ